MGVYEKEGVCHLDVTWDSNCLVFGPAGKPLGITDAVEKATLPRRAKWPAPGPVYRVKIRIEAALVSDEEARQYWEAE